MKKRDLLIAGLLLMGVPAFAQDGPEFTSQDSRMVFMQTFESDWETWTSTPIDTIKGVTYYNRLGDGNVSGTNVNIYDGSSDWDIYGVRDTTMIIYNGVLPTDDDPRVYGSDSYTIIEDQTAERAEAFMRFGESGERYVFRYVSGTPVMQSEETPWGIVNQAYNTEYSNGVTARYRRNLFVRGLDVDDNSSYRLTFYVKATQLGEISPVLYADVMRGYFSCEKPFSMANSTSSFEYEKKEFSGDWEKVTFMTYYTNDSIADAFVYKNGYWWGSGQWTWTEDDVEHNFIKQPDKYFVRLSFASDNTEFEIDNLSLTKSTIGGVEYYQDKIRVDFGYQTNLNILADAAYDQNKIAAVEVPGDYFEVWGQNANEAWVKIPIRSAEYHGDGYMYMFTSTYNVGGVEYPLMFDAYEKVLVTFHNPIDRPELALRYTGTLYPNSDNAEWVSNGKEVLDFYNEVATLNPYVFNGVFSMKELPPVMQAAPYEDGSFGIDETIRELSFQFSREVLTDQVVAYVGEEEWNVDWNDNKSSLVITRPNGYTTPLAGDLMVSLVNIQGVGTGMGDDVVMNYHFGSFERYPQASYKSSDWRSEINEEDAWNRPSPSSLYCYNSSDGFFVGNGYNSDTKCGLYKMIDDPDRGDCFFYLSPRTRNTYGNLYTVESLTAGLYSISFPAFGWGRNMTTSVFVYEKPYGEMDYETLNSADKDAIGSFVTSYQTSWSTYDDEHAWNDRVETFEFTFDIPTDGDYVIEWSVEMTGSQTYYGVAIGNYTVTTLGDLSSKPVINLNKAIDGALAVAYAARNNSQYYGGSALEELENQIDYYQYTFTSTAPSDWENARQLVNYYRAEQKSRMEEVDNYVSVLDRVWSILSDFMYNNELVKYYELSEHMSLKYDIYPRYSGQDLTQLTSDELYEQEQIMEEGISALEARYALSMEFQQELSSGWDVYNAAEYPEYEEYGVLKNVLNSFADYDDVHASSDGVQSAIKAVKKAVSNYSYKWEIISSQTSRIRELADLASSLGCDNNDLLEYAYTATEDDDALADALKAAVKVYLYQNIANGYDVDDISLTPFIKNYNLYATPKIVDRSEYQMPRDASALNYPDPDGANIQLVQHQYNNGDLYDHMPIWIMIQGQQYDDLIPGWSVMSEYASSGNRIVTVDNDSYEHFKNDVPVFDGQITLDWNSSATLGTQLTDLPVGNYLLGVEIPQLSSSASMTVNSYYSDGTVDSYYNEAYSSDNSGVLYVEEIGVYEASVVDVNFRITSGSGFSVADNFFMYYTPDPYVNYASLLADALDEYNAALAQLDITVPVDPSDPLANDKLYLAKAITYAQDALDAASEDIYAGDDYDNLVSAIENALVFDSDNAQDFYNMAESLYSYARKLNSRIYRVDDYLNSLSMAESVVEECVEYSYVEGYAELDSIYDAASALSITELTSDELISWSNKLYSACNYFVERLNGVLSGRLYMDEGLIGEAGWNMVIPVKLQTPTDITAFQFDVQLPYGFMLVDAKVAEDRINGHQLDYNLISDETYYDVRQSYRFTCVSLTNEVLVGNDGVIVYLTVKIDPYYSEHPDYTLSLYFYDIELTASPTDTYYPDNYYGYIKVIAPAMQGDVNGDGYVTITDAVGIVAFIINADVEGLDERAADANKDGDIDAADVVWVINKILGRNTATTPSGAPRRAAAKMNGSAENFITSTVSIDNAELATEMTVPVRMNGLMDEITAVQFNMTLPEGVILKGIKTDSKHMVSSNKVDGSYSVVCLSLKNSTFSGNGDEALTLELEADKSFNGGEVMLDKILVVTPDGLKQGNDPVVGLLGEGETGIRGIGADRNANMYDLQGRAIDNANGIYIQNGKKSILMK